MKKRNFLKKWLAVGLCIIMVLSMIGCSQENPSNIDQTQQNDGEQLEVEQQSEQEPITVIACSDFQNPGGSEEGANTVSSILSIIKESHPEADGFICAGDYDYDMSIYIGEETTVDGVSSLSNTIEQVYPDIKHMVYTSGNHDVYSADGLSESGDNDPEDGGYGVYAINEDDYMWASNPGYSESYSGKTAQEIISGTAAGLEEYLSEKASEQFTQPIFIVSHLPLHYNLRTRLDGDAMYANLIFDVVNKYAEAGLNIIYLYGHDHSNGWDDYLGGSAVFLHTGDSINIAQSSKFVFDEEKLAFTYMNAGFVGYYDNHNGADDALTMSVFEIYDDRVEISRYDSEGIHNLKSAGVHNFYKGESDSDYAVNDSVVEGVYTVELNTAVEMPAEEEVLDGEGSSQTEEPDSETGDEEQYEEGVYVRVTSASGDLEEGKYIFVYGSQIMSPVVVSKDGSSGTRTGFELVANEYAGETELPSDMEKYEWTLTKSDGKWLIGTPDGYIRLTETTDTAITATLESEGDLLTISGSGSYTIASAQFVLNYNSRGLINGYANQPAEFELYIKK